jgi:hypothetical protein
LLRSTGLASSMQAGTRMRLRALRSMRSKSLRR